MSLFFKLRCLDVCKLSLKTHYSTYTSVQRWCNSHGSKRTKAQDDPHSQFMSGQSIQMKKLISYSSESSKNVISGVIREPVVYFRNDIPKKKEVPMLVLSTSLYIDQHQMGGFLYIVN